MTHQTHRSTSSGPSAGTGANLSMGARTGSATSRRSFLAGTAATTALALSACSSGDDSAAGGSGDSGGPVTLQFWTYSLKGGDPAAQAIVDRYHELNPDVTIKLSEVGGTPETASKLLAADRADTAPDVVQIEYRALPSLVVAGVVADLTDAVADAKGGAEDNIWSLCTLDDTVYGVPQDIGPMMFTYRKDLFDQYGVKVPTTWAEYAAAAEAIHAADPSVYIASFAATQFEFFAAQAAQAGAKWWSNDGETWSVNLTDDASLATADFWQDLVRRDLVTVQPLLTPEWNAQVNAGKILSWAAAAWAPSVIYSVAPDTAGKWESAPLPQWTPGDSAVPFLGGSTYLVPAKSKHTEAAAKFAAWLGASDEGSKLLLTLDIYPGGNGGREATLESDPPRLMPQQTNFYEIADQVIDDTTITQTWGPNVNVATSTFGDALNEAALNNGSFRDVYATTQDAIIADLKKSGFTVSS
ncbi:multiple sugar transport system substrate-binding protein [Kineococcus radiotolerans]|uniref:Multiple sugar transport system substrate-binding protein n=1 Tax=Kineococcus radiotolerans TaxID=131568 RepID=A0A7W4TRI5_KINRA|nr:extracellular solute-binding protein [Kineococcus radiotolerans]MBB2903387.1 multiple sugar transport system substrate-binding protein [Kineococcus radiotolerans]